jgi:cell division protein FtsN
LPAGTTTRYFVQLAAYSAEPLAAGLAASLAATYPVQVRAPAATGGKVYRVMVGPLNRAESGTLLRFFRNRGFPDAFVKQE